MGKSLPKRFLAPIYYFLFRLIEDVRALKYLNFKITQFLAMRGIQNPLVRGLQADYWQGQKLGDCHSPDTYVDPDETTYELLNDLLKVTSVENSFLEIGCNSGRNLSFLYEKGYRKLGGIEINTIAINEVLKNKFPDLYRDSQLLVGNAAHQIKNIGTEAYDVVFSNAVLVHIEPKDISLFRDMARVAKKYIAIFTVENPTSSQPYKFEKIFEKLGFKMVQYKLFFGKTPSSCCLPIEHYDDKKHYYNASFIRIFIKNARP